MKTYIPWRSYDSRFTRDYLKNLIEGEFRYLLVFHKKHDLFLDSPIRKGYDDVLDIFDTLIVHLYAIEKNYSIFDSLYLCKYENGRVYTIELSLDDILNSEFLIGLFGLDEEEDQEVVYHIRRALFEFKLCHGSYND